MLSEIKLRERRYHEVILAHLGKPGSSPGGGGEDVKSETLSVSRSEGGDRVTQTEETACAQAGRWESVLYFKDMALSEGECLPPGPGVWSLKRSVLWFLLSGSLWFDSWLPQVVHCVFKEKKEREGGESLLVEVLTSRKFVQIVLTLVVGESMTQPSQRAIN